MVDNNVEMTSLCYVDTDYERLWLHRIADIVDGKLHRPFKSGRMDNYFENRDRLYRNDGPAEVGSVGVWDWTATPNKDNPEVDYVQSFFVSKKNPVRVVYTTAENVKTLAEQLVNGKIHVQPVLFCDTLFCCTAQRERLTGLLCKANEFQYVEKYAKLKRDIFVLPKYVIHVNEIFNCGEKHPHMQFLRDLEMRKPVGYENIGDPTAVIRNTLLDRFTWPFFKEYIGGTKAEWRQSHIVLERITDSNLFDAIAEKLKCSPKEARAQIDKYISEVAQILDTNDIDADILARVAMHHDELRAICEEAVASQWRKAHAEEIARAEADAKAKKNAAEKDVADTKQKLEKVKKELAAAQADKNKALADITEAQKRQEQLRAEIRQYEDLGKQTVANIQNKIADARKDVAGFIADISMFLPQDGNTAQSKGGTGWRYQPAPVNAYTEDEIEVNSSWKEEYKAVSDNLSVAMAVDDELSEMLAAFLYAAHINKLPLLIAGPGGRDVAETVSVSVYAASAGHLCLGSNPIDNLQEAIDQCTDGVICVQNMFGKAWASELPPAFARLKKPVIWTHPYAEDLSIEPAGLFNYMLPVFSECFISTTETLAPLPSKRTNGFKAYASGEKKPLNLSAFKKLKLSKLQFNQLTAVLSDAKAILNKPSKEKDLEVLCGLLPRCVIERRRDILKELLDTESGLSNTVKAEVLRYIEG